MINYDTVWQAIPENSRVSVNDFFAMACDDGSDLAPATASRYHKTASYFLKKRVEDGEAYRDYSGVGNAISYVKNKDAGTFPHGIRVALTWNSNIGKTLTTKQLTKRVNNSFKAKISSGYMTKLLNEICNSFFGTKQKVGKNNTYYLDSVIGMDEITAITDKLKMEIAGGFKNSTDKAVKGASKESGGKDHTQEYSADESMTLVPTAKVAIAQKIHEAQVAQIADLKGELTEVLDEVTALKAELRSRPNPAVDNMDWLSK